MDRIYFYDKSVLAKFKKGVVVEMSSCDRIGHVYGFHVTPSYEVIVMVEWPDGVIGSVHPLNLTILE